MLTFLRKIEAININHQHHYFCCFPWYWFVTYYYPLTDPREHLPHPEASRPHSFSISLSSVWWLQFLISLQNPSAPRLVRWWVRLYPISMLQSDKPHQISEASDITLSQLPSFNGFWNLVVVSLSIVSVKEFPGPGNEPKSVGYTWIKSKCEILWRPYLLM